METEDQTTEILNGGVSETQVEAWKQQHRKSFAIRSAGWRRSVYRLFQAPDIRDNKGSNESGQSQGKRGVFPLLLPLPEIKAHARAMKPTTPARGNPHQIMLARTTKIVCRKMLIAVAC